VTTLTVPLPSHADRRAPQIRSSGRGARRIAVRMALPRVTGWLIALASGGRLLSAMSALRPQRVAAFAVASLVSLPALAALPSPPQDATLKAVVLLSRHGMRGPTVATRCSGPDDTRCLDAVAHDPWPDLDVSAGHLTASGYDRVVTMGRFYRAHYAEAGLLPAQGCPAPGTTAFRSDAVERTTMTAGAISDGMFPGCNPSRLEITPRLYEGPACGFEEARAAKAAQALAGGSWVDLAQGPLKEPLAELDSVLGRFKPAACKAAGAPAECSLATIPISAANRGPIGIASQPAEQFLMQYGGGLAAGEVAWGRLPDVTGKPLAEAIGYVNAVHATSDRMSYMPEYTARKKGSPVLYPVLRALQAAVEGRGAPFTFFASHDDLILNVAGMLDLSWQLESYAPFQVPPGGAVAFEVWQHGRTPLIRLVYYAQTIQQLHDDTPLTAAQPPAAAVLAPPGCKPDATGACTWTAFRQLATQKIEMACVDPKRAE